LDADVLLASGSSCSRRRRSRRPSLAPFAGNRRRVVKTIVVLALDAARERGRRGLARLSSEAQGRFPARTSDFAFNGRGALCHNESPLFVNAYAFRRSEELHVGDERGAPFFFVASRRERQLPLVASGDEEADRREPPGRLPNAPRLGP